jgi:hypothetical protein
VSGRVDKRRRGSDLFQVVIAPIFLVAEVFFHFYYKPGSGTRSRKAPEAPKHEPWPGESVFVAVTASPLA